jgi:hypothetical protein
VARVPSKQVQAEAVGATAAVAKRQAAAPSFSDLASTFGPQGLDYGSDGKVKGYRYPTPKNDDDRKRINSKVYEMWNPQRKIATQMGGEHNASVSTTTLLDRKSGMRQVVPQHLAESKAKKVGLVEAPNWKGRRVMVADASGKLWRVDGDRWVEV